MEILISIALIAVVKKSTYTQLPSLMYVLIVLYITLSDPAPVPAGFQKNRIGYIPNKIVVTPLDGRQSEHS